MTDANLMDADCIHGIVWYECRVCEALLDEGQQQEAAKFLRDKGWTVIPPNVGGMARVHEP